MMTNENVKTTSSFERLRTTVAPIKYDDRSKMSTEETKVHIENVEPALNCSIPNASGHSTPIRNKDRMNRNEYSPELERHCSPILLPCTQEGINEVAWDWQNSLIKTSDGSNKNSNSPSSCTPKRNSLLQKRRAVKSNSPLLYKPIKRKLIKAEKAESIGQFAAELKALTDRMITIQRTEENQSSLKENEIGDKLMLEMKIGEEEERDGQSADGSCDKLTANGNKSGSKAASLDDLFDNSILDDYMVKCSQEVEEKFSMARKPSLCATNSTENSRDKGSSISYEAEFHFVTTTDSSNENTSDRSNSSASRDAKQGASTLQKHGTEKTGVWGDKNTALDEDEYVFSQIPDDSFDDCLATCPEGNEVSKVLQSGRNDTDLKKTSNRYGKVYQNTTHGISTTNAAATKDGGYSAKTPAASLGVASARDYSSSSNAHSTNDRRAEVPYAGTSESSRKFFKSRTGLTSGHDQNSSNSACTKTEPKVDASSLAPSGCNRKFFKLKSLSEPHFAGQQKNANTGAGNSERSHLRPILKSSSNASLNVKSWSNAGPRSGAGSSVSTKSPMKYTARSFGHDLTSTNASGNNAHGQNLHRFAAKEENSIRNKQDSSVLFHQEVRESKDGLSQAVQCTPEEIERKRLEAKMRLEAKKKMQLNQLGAVTGLTIRGAVKR